MYYYHTELHRVLFDDQDQPRLVTADPRTIQAIEEVADFFEGAADSLSALLSMSLNEQKPSDRLVGDAANDVNKLISMRRCMEELARSCKTPKTSAAGVHTISKSH